MNKFLLKLAAPLIIGLFSIACNFILGGSGGNSPSGGNAPDSFQVPSNSGGQSPTSGNGKISIQLPSSPDIPPADVIQQITLSGGGGSGVICTSNCVASFQPSFFFTNFQPNQKLRVEFYYPTHTRNDGVEPFKFLTEILVQTDNEGKLEINIMHDDEYFALIVLDEGGNIIFKPETMQ